ncbi:MAG: SMC-Scp complex subunit ScpB [Eubacterium sp.]
MDNKRVQAIIEAILFTMGESVELDKISAALEMDNDEVRDIIMKMKEQYNDESRGIRIIELENSFQISTKPELYEYLIKIAKQPRKQVMTDVLLETLSIIAYKQPITKAEIERIRGVKCDHAVNKLIEYELVTELGRLETPGRPLVFGTTEEFLRRFGVDSIENLPDISLDKMEDFKMEAEEEINLKSND